MPDLIHLEQQLLTHNLQGADLLGVALLREVNLSIASLSNLSENLEVSIPKTGPPFPEVGSFLSQILFVSCFVLDIFGCRGFANIVMEICRASLAVVDVTKKIKVVVEEVCEAVS